MNTTDGFINYVEDSNDVKDVLLTYSEEERQQNEINKENAKLVFSPKFIPFYPKLLDSDLSFLGCLLFGFIDFYLGISENKRFYFTNEQMAMMFKCSESSINNSMKILEDVGLIKRHQKVRAGGGTIRFVEISQSEYEKTNTLTVRKLTANKNKINNNKIKEKGSTPLISQIEQYKDDYSPALREDFMLYWSQCDTAGRQRWQLEKIWDIDMRLKQWKRREEKWDYEQSQRAMIKSLKD